MKAGTLISWSKIILFVGFGGMIALALLCDSGKLHGQQTPPKTDLAAEDLRQIGMKILDAVLKKDLVALLGYESPTLRTEHETALKNKSSDTYCFLIDSHSSCTRIPGGGVWPPSVFETISGAHRPGVAVIGDGRNAVLLFYDRSAISERSIRSIKFICAPANFHKYASWSFTLVNGKWESTGELFNYESEGPC